MDITYRFIGGPADGKTFDVADRVVACDYPYLVGEFTRIARYILSNGVFKYSYG